MRHLLTAALLAAPLALCGQAAHADLRCYQDSWGNVRCIGDDGSSVRQNTYGNTTRTVINDGYGGMTTCRTTGYGLYSRTSCN